jgi:CRP-like cAMP-binding protein
MALDKAAKARWLEGVPLFAGCDRDVIERVAEVTTEEAFEAGETIVRQGHVGNGLCIVVDGAVRVVAGTSEIGRLGPGDHFGELSVIDQQPRSASVVADAPTVCLALASWDLMALLRTQPTLAINLLRGLSSRLRRADAQLRD